jgi:hypothetical protein
MGQFEILHCADAVEKVGDWRGAAPFESFLTSFLGLACRHSLAGLQLG